MAAPRYRPLCAAAAPSVLAAAAVPGKSTRAHATSPAAAVAASVVRHRDGLMGITTSFRRRKGSSPGLAPCPLLGNAARAGLQGHRRADAGAATVRADAQS